MGTIANGNDSQSDISYEPIIANHKRAPVWLGVIIAFAYSMVIIFGAFGNILTIFIVLRNKSMRTVQNFFIINLALGDFMICTITAPITFFNISFTFWKYGNALCKFVSSIGGFNIFLSTFSITAIALDRYFLVIFPTQQQRQKFFSIILFALIWIISLLLSIPIVIVSSSTMFYEVEFCNLTLYLCNENELAWDKMPFSKLSYTISIIVIHYAFPIVSMVFAYTKIASRMHSRFVHRNNIKLIGEDANNRRKHVAERQRRTNFLLASLVLLFAIAWLPFNIFHMLLSLKVITYSGTLFALCHLMGMMSACLNPVCYAFFNQNFRNELFIILHKLKLRKNSNINGINRTEYSATVKRSTCMGTNNTHHKSVSTVVMPDNSLKISIDNRSISQCNLDTIPMVPILPQISNTENTLKPENILKRVGKNEIEVLLEKD
ncbi:Neuropeptide F receptor [Strongyloides ratti]|uniref:Neuropeptide F receptor n=1 Tax=Strongyloides ratti TaxID=34506 RepID=A0A090LUG6_STRRB|nr:Neuropeptide F receptor [Strongyloides ratti]CEF71249.1 Neuropeptide F receptor [Strongyloides ratti]